MKKANRLTINKVHKKFDMRRFKHNETNYEVTCDGHPSYVKTYFMNILRCFDHHKCSLEIYFIMSEPYDIKFIFHEPPT